MTEPKSFTEIGKMCEEIDVLHEEINILTGSYIVVLSREDQAANRERISGEIEKRVARLYELTKDPIYLIP